MSRGVFPTSDRTLLVATCVLWAVAWVAWTADWLLEPMAFAGDRALRRIPVCLAGGVLCWAMSRPLRMVAGQKLSRRLLVALGLCTAASLVLGAVGQAVFAFIAPRWDAPSVTGWIGGAMTDFWVFAAWSALFFALDYDIAARDSRLALADAHADLLEAQNLALVRQIDPHFLFNALNTVSGLIEEGDTERADRTTLALARLLRNTVQRDLPPFRTLGEELAAQSGYLDVQLARFPDRFTFVDAVPDALRAQRVPTLILQPLIENAFTHGVANSEERVTLQVSAVDEGGRVTIIVCDDAAPARHAVHQGAGIGLDNVRRRLETLYGPTASLTCAPRAPQGWAAKVSLP